jgi:hypothetical protein
MSPRLLTSDNTSVSFATAGNNGALEYFLPTDEDATPVPLEKVLYMLRLYEVGPSMVTIVNNCHIRQTIDMSKQ